MLEGLFSFCAVVPIFITFWGVSEFQDTYHGFVYFLTFSIFLSGFFILLVREKHRKTLYKFLFAKIKGWNKNNRDKNAEHNKQITKINGRQNNDFNFSNWVLKDGSSQYYSSKLQRNGSTDNYYGPLLKTSYEKTTAKVIPSSN